MLHTYSTRPSNNGVVKTQFSSVTVKMKFAFIFMLVTILHFQYLKSKIKNVYYGPAPAREVFYYNDNFFYFYSDYVSWHESKAICEANNMHLATLDDLEKAKFIALSMAKAWAVFEDMWIGATKVEKDQWQWDYTKSDIPENSQIFENYSFSYPPWVYNEIPVRDGKDCLAIDRNAHNDPYFIDLACKLPRPFICEQTTQENKDEPWEGGVVETFDTEYILYHGRLSWHAAVSFCSQQGYTLTTIENMAVAMKLTKAMLKARPQFENVWIGATLKGEQWIWVEDGEEIQTILGTYRDPNRGETSENSMSLQFPPWIKATKRKGRDCVLLNRHLYSEPKFVSSQCNRQRGFICMYRKESLYAPPSSHIFYQYGKRYIFYPVAATWTEAKRICDEESERTTMLNLTDIEEIKFIMQAMAHVSNPVNHLWLGGRIEDGEWVWIGRDLKKENKKIPMVSDKTEFPPWCSNEINIERACLNLDRQNNWTPLIYGLECNATQAVVCVEPLDVADRIIKYDGKSKQDPPTVLRVSNLVNHPLSANEANQHCQKDGGDLWRPRFDLQSSKQAIKKLLEALKNTQNKDTDANVYHINGGKYKEKQKSWIYSGKKIQINTEWLPRDGDCLIGHINESISEWAWYPVNCQHKLYSQIICHPRCSLIDVPYELENSEWSCDALASDIFEHKMLGMRCTHRCPNGYAIQGPDSFYCSKRGWFSNQANIPVHFSKCKNLTSALNIFKGLSQNISTLQFIVDSTTQQKLADYNTTKYLIANLINYYSVNLQNVVIYVTSIQLDLEESIALKVDGFHATQNCEEIRKYVLHHLAHTGVHIRNYEYVMKKTIDSLNGTSSSEINIVFVLSGANLRDNFRNNAWKRNRKVKIFGIGTNRHSHVNQLVNIVSRTSEESLAIQFKKPTDAVLAVKSLMHGCSKCRCARAFDDIVESFIN